MSEQPIYDFIDPIDPRLVEASIRRQESIRRVTDAELQASLEALSQRITSGEHRDNPAIVWDSISPTARTPTTEPTVRRIPLIGPGGSRRRPLGTLTGRALSAALNFIEQADQAARMSLDIANLRHVGESISQIHDSTIREITPADAERVIRTIHEAYPDIREHAARAAEQSRRFAEIYGPRRNPCEEIMLPDPAVVIEEIVQHETNPYTVLPNATLVDYSRAELQMAQHFHQLYQNEPREGIVNRGQQMPIIRNNGELILPVSAAEKVWHLRFVINAESLHRHEFINFTMIPHCANANKNSGFHHQALGSIADQHLIRIVRTAFTEGQNVRHASNPGHTTGPVWLSRQPIWRALTVEIYRRRLELTDSQILRFLMFDMPKEFDHVEALEFYINAPAGGVELDRTRRRGLIFEGPAPLQEQQA